MTSPISFRCISPGCTGIPFYGWLGTPDRRACREHVDLVWPKELQKRDEPEQGRLI